jgi:hypothetical protein
MKFGGNTSYGPRMFHKKFENFGAFLVKMVKIYVNFQNHAKS